MAYNAFPDGLSSTPLSSLDGGGGGGYGYDSSDMQQGSAVAAAQAQAQANAQLQAKLQAQANQAAQMSQAYALAPPQSGSLVMTGSAKPAAASAPAESSDPGYLETLWEKRRDVAKLCILALAILLAISAHSAAWHYIREFIETAPNLNEWHELALRLAYPLIVLIVLWNLKAFQ